MSFNPLLLFPEYLYSALGYWGVKMLKRTMKNRHKSRQAFTLVELIVVLVILAVLSAALVPALVGYIKRARRARYIQKADEARIAAQATLAEFYAYYSGDLSEALDSSANTAQNVNWWKGDLTDYGDEVLELMGYGRDQSEGEPYIMVIGVGHDEAAGLTEVQKNTVYYVGYIEELGDPALFYVDGKWSYQWPRDSGDLIMTGDKKGMNRNVLVTDEGEIPLRFYVICNQRGDDKIWLDKDWTKDKNTLEGNSEGHHGY